MPRNSTPARYISPRKIIIHHEINLQSLASPPPSPSAPSCRSFRRRSFDQVVPSCGSTSAATLSDRPKTSSAARVWPTHSDRMPRPSSETSLMSTLVRLRPHSPRVSQLMLPPRHNRPRRPRQGTPLSLSCSPNPLPLQLTQPPQDNPHRRHYQTPS